MEEKEHASLHTELQLALAEEWLPLIAACPSQVRDHCSSPIEATAKLTRLGLSPFSHLLFQAQPEALYCTELTSSINSESAGLSRGLPLGPLSCGILLARLCTSTTASTPSTKRACFWVQLTT